MNWSLRFLVPPYPFSCSVRITISCQFYAQHASRFCTKIGTTVPIFVLGRNHIFVPAQTCPNSNVTNAMVNHRSYSKYHLQPYKRFIQMAYNCGTPLILILHVQNGYIKSGLLRQSFEFFAFLDRVILGKLLKNW